MDQHDDDLICVGHVLGAQGIKGWIRVFSNTSPRENIVSYSPWLIEQGDGLEEVKVTGRLQGKNVIAKLQGIDGRTRAETLTGCKLYIDSRQLPGLENGEYYWSDLIGLAVETLQSEPPNSRESGAVWKPFWNTPLFALAIAGVFLSFQKSTSARIRSSRFSKCQ